MGFSAFFSPDKNKTTVWKFVRDRSILLKTWVHQYAWIKRSGQRMATKIWGCTNKMRLTAEKILTTVLWDYQRIFLAELFYEHWTKNSVYYCELLDNTKTEFRSKTTELQSASYDAHNSNQIGGNSVRLIAQIYRRVTIIFRIRWRMFLEVKDSVSIKRLNSFGAVG